jgi:hypothetical protein
MKKIKNIFKKRLNFPQFDFTIDTNEIKEIQDELYERVKSNMFIELVREKQIEQKVDQKLEEINTIK